MAATKLKPVYALVGTESFLQMRALAGIVASMTPGTQRMDVDGEQAELHEVLDELRSFSMFSSQKLVVVRSADDFVSRYREKLEAYVEHPVDNGVLVLRLSSLPKNQRIYKSIMKIGEVQETVAPKDLTGWVLAHARTAHRLTLSPDAAELLADLVGADLGRLDNELAKLALQYDDARIDARQVGASVAFQREQQMWDMTNELTAGHTDQAVRRWRRLVQLDTSAEFRAVTWLSMWLENARKALQMLRLGHSPSSVCQELRIWQRALQQPFIRGVQRMGEHGIRRAVDRLAQVDQQNKSGVGQAATNVERFLISLTH